MGRGFGAGDGLVAIATLLWSVNIVVVKVGLANAGPLTYASLRFLVGGLVLSLLARRLEGPSRAPVTSATKRPWLLAAAAASGVAVSQAAFTGALALTNVDFVAMVFGATPLLVSGWLAWHGKVHFGVRVWAGLLMGFIGVAIVVATPGGGHTSWLGIAAALGSTVSSAIYVLLLPRLLGRYRPLTLAARISLLGGCMLVPFGAIEAIAHHPHITWAWVGLLAFSALGAVAVTNWLYLASVRRLGPARAASYSYLEPFLGVLAASLLIREPVIPLQLLGGIIIVFSIAFGWPRAVSVAGPVGVGGAVAEVTEADFDQAAINPGPPSG
ncbi:MAG: DMT family transporter [Candidatus Dormibacteria bacterium]